MALRITLCSRQFRPPLDLGTTRPSLSFRPTAHDRRQTGRDTLPLFRRCLGRLLHYTFGSDRLWIPRSQRLRLCLRFLFDTNRDHAVTFLPLLAMKPVDRHGSTSVRHLQLDLVDVRGKKTWGCDARYYARLLESLRRACRSPGSSEQVAPSGFDHTCEPEFACHEFARADVIA